MYALTFLFKSRFEFHSKKLNPALARWQELTLFSIIRLFAVRETLSQFSYELKMSFTVSEWIGLALLSTTRLAANLSFRQDVEPW